MRTALTLLAALLLLVAGPGVADDRFFDSNGVRIRYLEQGGGVPVLLVHGFTGSIEHSWINSKALLADLALDYRVVALDLRGHGKSDKPHRPEAYEEIALDVVRLLDYLRIARAHVVGYSLGGIIVARLLVTHPQRFITATMGGAAHRRSQSAASDRAAEAAAVELERGQPYRILILSTAPTDEPQPSEAAIQARSAALAERNDLRAHAALYRARRALVVTDAEITAVRVPTQAIVGTADSAHDRVYTLSRRWPALKFIPVEGATHSTGHDRGLPSHPRFVAEVRAFIQAHSQ